MLHSGWCAITGTRSGEFSRKSPTFAAFFNNYGFNGSWRTKLSCLPSVLAQLVCANFCLTVARWTLKNTNERVKNESPFTALALEGNPKKVNWINFTNCLFPQHHLHPWPTYNVQTKLCQLYHLYSFQLLYITYIRISAVNHFGFPVQKRIKKGIKKTVIREIARTRDIRSRI